MKWTLVPIPFCRRHVNEFVAVDPQPVQIEPENVKVPRMAARGAIGRQFHIIPAGEFPMVGVGLRGAKRPQNPPACEAGECRSPTGYR